MRFDSEVRVTGAKMFKGEVEGEKYDSTTVFIETGLDESKGTAKGAATSSFQWGDSQNFERIKGLPFPVMCMVTFELTTNGKGGTKQILVDLKPKAKVQ